MDHKKTFISQPSSHTETETGREDIIRNASLVFPHRRGRKLVTLKLISPGYYNSDHRKKSRELLMYKKKKKHPHSHLNPLIEKWHSFGQPGVKWLVSKPHILQ